MKKIFLLITAGVAIAITSCKTNDPNSPGFEFTPDMYRQSSYEANSSNPNFADSMTNRNPVNGTVAHGYLPYPYPNSDSGYAWAGRYLRNPLTASEANMEQGKKLYTNFCSPCHGASGKGDGKVGDKLPGPPPAFDGPLKNLPEGKMFHSIQYGKGLMGSHASQLSAEERWKIVHYVKTLQGPPVTAQVESTASDTTKK